MLVAGNPSAIGLPSLLPLLRLFYLPCLPKRHTKAGAWLLGLTAGGSFLEAFDYILFVFRKVVTNDRKVEAGQNHRIAFAFQQEFK